MGNSSLKLPLGVALNEIARQRALDHVHLTGKGLPCSIVAINGAIATVKFEVGGGYTLPNVQMPIATSQYTRDPHQVGDKGHAMPNAAPTSNMSGLGPSGAPGLAEPGNLAALSFHPIGNVNWTNPPAGQAIHQGPNGGVAQTMDGKNQAGGILGGVLLTAGGVSAVLTPSMVAKIAALLGSFVTGGGGGGGGNGAVSSISSGTSQMTALTFAYQYVQPTTGATATITAGVVVTTIDPTGTIAALTIAFPASPTDGQVQFLSFTQSVTALSLTAGSFAANIPTSVPAGGGAWIFQYQAAAAKWFLI